MSILTIIFTKATKIVTENITLYCWVFTCLMQEVRDHLCTGFSCLHHVLCTTDDVIKGPVNMEKTCPGYVEGSLACPSYRGKSQLLLRISLQNVTNCCMSNKALARLFFDGLVTRLAWPTFLHANTLTRPGSARSTGPTPDNHSEHALAPYQLLANKTADISRRHW